jgi:hypothetical protein
MALGTGWLARFTGPGEYDIHYERVVRFDDRGQGWVLSEDEKSLCPATDFPNFDGYEYQQETVIPAPPDLWVVFWIDHRNIGEETIITRQVVALSYLSRDGEERGDSELIILLEPGSWAVRLSVIGNHGGPREWMCLGLVRENSRKAVEELLKEREKDLWDRHPPIETTQSQFFF